jgi:iron only hydrogenase large subunit-like protein
MLVETNKSSLHCGFGADPSIKASGDPPVETLKNRGLEALLGDLRQGRAVRMLVAPAAFKLLGNLENILGFFRHLGVRSFHPVLPYADITLWAYFTLLGETRGKLFICSACAGLNSYLREPDYPYYLAPVYSPLLCTARYLRNYRRLEGDFAFLSPCRLKEKEFVTREGENLVRYNITIRELGAFLAKEALELSLYPALKPEPDDFCPGLTLAASGSVGGVLGALLPEKEFVVKQGLAETASWLRGQDPFQDTVLEAYACPGGCLYGSGTGQTNNAAGSAETKGSGDGRALPQAPEYTEALRRLFARYARELRITDFCHSVEPSRRPAV